MYESMSDINPACKALIIPIKCINMGGFSVSVCLCNCMSVGAEQVARANQDNKTNLLTVHLIYLLHVIQYFL